LRIPATQLLHLSDAALQPHAPLKGVIEETLHDFLASSRRRDRVLVVFVGHLVEVGSEAYLVPIEGHLDEVATLIPLKGVFKQLAECKARQKVLLLDVCRAQPTRGAERPSGGPLSTRLEEILKKTPKGVQVWAGCSAEQHSYEMDNSPGRSLFLD